MASSSQLQQRMCCGVCMETYDHSTHVPKWLPCQHTLCKACICRITDWRSLPPGLHCPICRSPHVIPQEGFATNRALMDIVEELQKDATVKSPSALKCTKHANKEAGLVCIDCLDALCFTCIKSSMQIHAKHHIEEVDEAAPVLQQKFKDSQISFEKKLEGSPCSSTELAKANQNIRSLARKIRAEATKWENEQLSMTLEMQSLVDAHEKKKRELNSNDCDLNILLLTMKQYQFQSNDDFMQKLHQHQAEDQIRFDKSYQTLLTNLRVAPINAIQSKYLKKAASVTSADVPKITEYMEKVRVTNPDVNGFSGVTPTHGDIIAVLTDECGGRWLGWLAGIHERSGNQCKFLEENVTYLT